LFQNHKFSGRGNILKQSEPQKSILESLQAAHNGKQQVLEPLFEAQFLEIDPESTSCWHGQGDCARAKVPSGS